MFWWKRSHMIIKSFWLQNHSSVLARESRSALAACFTIVLYSSLHLYGSSVTWTFLRSYDSVFKKGRCHVLFTKRKFLSLEKSCHMIKKITLEIYFCTWSGNRRHAHSVLYSRAPQLGTPVQRLNKINFFTTIWLHHFSITEPSFLLHKMELPFHWKEMESEETENLLNS